MALYAVYFSAGMCGTDEWNKIEADSEDEAVRAFEPEAWEHFWNHNDQDEDSYDDDIGSVDGMQAELDIYAELYDPAKHDGHF